MSSGRSRLTKACVKEDGIGEGLKAMRSIPRQGLLKNSGASGQVDLIEQDRIWNMPSRYEVRGLLRHRHAWLAVTLAVAVLCAQTTQSLIAQRAPVEVANAA